MDLKNEMMSGEVEQNKLLLLVKYESKIIEFM